MSLVFLKKPTNCVGASSAQYNTTEHYNVKLRKKLRLQTTHQKGFCFVRLISHFCCHHLMTHCVPHHKTVIFLLLFALEMMQFSEYLLSPQIQCMCTTLFQPIQLNYYDFLSSSYHPLSCISLFDVSRKIHSMLMPNTEPSSPIHIFV